MNKKTLIIIAAIAFALIGVLGLTLYLLQSQQDVRSRADNSTPVTNQATSPTGTSISTQQSCPLPAQVQNVTIDFPNCVGDECNFTQAGCSWTSIAGATKYQVTITQVDDNTSISNEQVDASVTNKVFDVKDGFTYKCDVAAINTCGTAGSAGSNTLLCKVDAAVATATPTPSPVPQVACGSPCTSASNCQAGYICAIGANGQGNCALPAAASACQASPSVSSCCSVATVPPPTATPTVPPTGEIGTTTIAGVGTVLLIIVGVIMFAL